MNDRVEKLAEGCTRAVIGELQGLRGGSILACGCMHVNICVQNKFYWVWASPHTEEAQGGGQRAVAGEAGNDDELSRRWFFLL